MDVSIFSLTYRTREDVLNKYECQAFVAIAESRIPQRPVSSPTDRCVSGYLSILEKLNLTTWNE